MSLKLAHYEAVIVGAPLWALERAEGAAVASAAFSCVRLLKHNRLLRIPTEVFKHAASQTSTKCTLCTFRPMP